MVPFNILEQIVSPFSLSLRLYGNIFAEEMLLAMIAGMIPMIVPIPIMGLAILFGTIQAVVFTTLASIYIGHAVHSEEPEEQGQPGVAGRPAVAPCCRFPPPLAKAIARPGGCFHRHNCRIVHHQPLSRCREGRLRAWMEAWIGVRA